MVEVTKRIEEKTSRMAEYTCSSRASSYCEKSDFYHSEDYVAAKMVPWFVRLLIKNGFIRKSLLSVMAPKGAYEYVIARTKYIDAVFDQAVSDGVEQVLIFGAGFDSRSIRLLPNDSPVKVFEVDAPVTQQAKMNRLEEIGIGLPENTVYVGVDFNKEAPEQRLVENGFQYGKHCLFILEGLLMYLDEDAVDETMNLIKRINGPESRIVFDYIYSSVLRHEEKHYGDEDLHKNVEDVGEPWGFGVEEGSIGEYLSEHGFRIVEELDGAMLDKRYFTDSYGKLVGRVNGSHSIVLAEPI
ncbi:MAG: SAM-dependent methyltransferase [Candidatus Bathyarchaeota archaeon]|nr:SAM-dependent methyltransferase [Candidatus Bathyarchaeota archaeon]